MTTNNPFNIDDSITIDLSSTDPVDTLNWPSSSSIFTAPTISGTGGGAPGAYLTSGSGGTLPGCTLNWSSMNDTITLGNYSQNELHVQGNARVTGDLTVAGISVGETLKRIEERLNILRPNTELESRWDELRELGRRYRELEAELLEKEQMWAQLTK